MGDMLSTDSFPGKLPLKCSRLSGKCNLKRSKADMMRTLANAIVTIRPLVPGLAAPSTDWCKFRQVT